MPGHLFVLRGDLTRLACDAVVLSCDDRLNINPVWKPLLPEGLAPGDLDWLRLDNDRIGDNVIRLPQVDKRRIYATITTPTNSDATPGTVAQRIVDGIQTAASGLQAQDGRHLPLIAVPLVGTGTGGLRERRGEVIEALLPALRRAAQGFDIALVLWNRPDLAAVQHRRTDGADWTELSPPLRLAADRLGERAAHGQLSLFIGAGVSRPVGLPDWWSLLKDLAREANLAVDWAASADPVEVATPIVAELGDRFHDAIRERLGSSKHGIGHGLLAGLAVRQMVTTNFDPCMELALDAESSGKYRVLTRHISDASMPWLLKLHGDINRPGSLVLDGAQYQTHAEEYAALHGVVQSLLLTSHLLFVGFSMTDRNFLKMAAAVARVRRDAVVEDGSPLPPAGTALALTQRDRQNNDLNSELELLNMTDEADPGAAARILEIFLDRLAWTAARNRNLSAEYLLDERYATGLNADDRALRAALQAFEAGATMSARQSAGWARVEETLLALGGTGTATSGPHPGTTRDQH
ncbi:SIR2 family protein [Microlunatus capsulatus]|uniref:SIR2-like domain-containing protein n=1 Tax=Microlunatus capsulatus TaxID=99117 RepID=A0ABS4Z751_9ACTN|nr:SIR2 family protein [Microlunatus capsulatus]MBP2416875.1 hypothetical protein [Microlunatus capsulatus]